MLPFRGRAAWRVGLSRTFIAAASLLWAVSGAFAQLDFTGARHELLVGGTPRAVGVADLNNDGKPDLVVTNGSSDNLSILLGAGGGVFRRDTKIPTGRAPERLVLASLDSNTDSISDLAVASFLDDQVQVFLGNGAGGFGSPTSFSTGTGSNPKGLSVLDWNLDGKKDLLVVLTGTNQMRLYEGNGLGGFSLHSTYPVGLTPAEVVTGDWDGDNKTDAAVTNEVDGTVTVYYGGPAGFQSCGGCVFTLPVSANPTSIAAGLLNNDPFPDLVVASSGADVNENPLPVSILYGDPDFGFSTVTPLVTGGKSFSVAIADFNGDTKSDLAVGLELSAGQGKVSIFTGDGFGTFTAGVTVPVGSTPVSIAAQDLGGTSAVDLATVNTAARSVSLLSGDGAGGFTATPTHLISPAAALSALASADLSGDGKTDLAVTRANLNQVDLLLGSGSGTFSPWQTLSLPTGVGPALAAAVLIDRFTSPDLNLDLAVANSGLDSVSIFSGNGAGAFTGPTSYSVGGTGITPKCLVAAPLNDTDTLHPDLAVANGEGDSSFPNGSVSILLQGGTGFLAATRINGGNTPAGITAGLVNGDTARDLVVANFGAATSSLLTGTGTGTFSAPVPTPTGIGPNHPILRDLDGDGDQDLVVVNNGAETASVFLGNGGGGFTPSGQPGCGPGPARGVLADLNLDGWDDLAVNNTGSGAITVLLGDGAGHFGLPVALGVGALPRDISTADYNGDGKPDLAAANELDGTLSILLNASQDPILALSQSITPPGTQVSWAPFFEAGAYDVIRGSVDLVTQTATQINLGAVTCVENDSPDGSTAGNEDNAIPVLGKALFYLFRSVDSQVRGSYGRSTTGKLRVVGSGDCL